MKQIRLISAAIICFLLLIAAGSGTAAFAAQPVEPIPPEGAEMPPLEGGTPYGYPLQPSQPGLPETPTSADDVLAIDVWYGEDQTFGQLGTPQNWINILGSVSGPLPEIELTYSLNGGPEEPLSVGPDRMRLFGEGDFNIELDYQTLTPTPGENSVTITADDGQTQVQKTVIVRYEAGNIWPLPYTAHWSTVASVQEAGQVVDGLWQLEDGALENVFPGFDRLVAIGDLSWTDYEVTVPFTVHTLNSDGWTGPSNGGGVGLIVRWQGHYSLEDEQPRLGWRHLGALGWYHWSPTGSAAFELRGEDGRILDTESVQKVRLGIPTFFKLRVESVDGPSVPATYSFKFWEADRPEPAQWTMQSVGREGEPLSGSVVLVAHQSEVTFGNVTILPLEQDGLTVTVGDSEHGSIQVSPDKPYYQPGEEVEFLAVPEEGYKFAGWQGDLSGSENPLSLAISKDMVVNAVFEPETYRVFISPVANGKVDGMRFRAGDILRYDYQNGWRHVLSATDSPFRINDDVEAFTFLPDDSLLVVLSRNRNIDGLGKVTPFDVLRLPTDADGGYASGPVEWYLDGSEAGLSTGGERIDAIAIDGNGRLLVSLKGTGRVPDGSGATLVVRDEDLITYRNSDHAWEVACDGSLVPGLASENVIGLSVDAVTGAFFVRLGNGFKIAGVKGTARDILSLSDCTPDAQAQVVWNARDDGFNKPYDALHFTP